MGKYFKLGLKIGVIHLIAVSIYFTFFFNSTIGLIIILCIAIVISLTILLQYLNKRKKPHIQTVSETGNAEKNPLDAQEKLETNNSI
jgi:ABC-type protease/lipase transport system fused ATPase/permease subunit